MKPEQSLLKSKMFWVGVLYFAEGFPLGVYYDLFPVHFRQQGVELWQIGFMSLLGLSWTLKFLWAPAIDYYRHHRRWMFAVDLLMGATMLVFAIGAGFGPWVWFVIGCFTFLSATNDIAIDGYTIELLTKREMGLANGLRIAFYRVGLLAAGALLISSDYLGWNGTYVLTAVTLCLLGYVCLHAPREKHYGEPRDASLLHEFKALLQNPYAFALVTLFALGVLWLINSVTAWSGSLAYFWPLAFAVAGVLFSMSLIIWLKAGSDTTPGKRPGANQLTQGLVFGTLLAMLQRPFIVPVLAFILLFKLADSSMGFMIKPFWVDAGFSATQIGLVSVNIGLVLSIAGGVAGGWFTDRVGIFNGLWILGLLQAFSNLGYALAAAVIPYGIGSAPLPEHKLLIYGASALESFTGGLGTAAFLAFLMAIVNKNHSATEYALLSSVFALSRSFAGWAGGFGAQWLGYAPYFLLTFALAFPAYALLPWVKKMMRYADAQEDWHQE